LLKELRGRLIFQAAFAVLLWQPVHDVLYQHVGCYHLILTDRIPPSLILFHLLLELMGKARIKGRPQKHESLKLGAKVMQINEKYEDFRGK